MTSNWQTSSFVFSLFADDPCELKQPKWGVILSPFFPQVEFSYPPLMPDEGHDSNLLPEEWKYLPFLALPDGAHNYQEGTAQTHFVIKSYEVLQRSQCYFICRVLTDCLQMEHFSAETSNVLLKLEVLLMGPCRVFMFSTCLQVLELPSTAQRRVLQSLVMWMWTRIVVYLFVSVLCLLDGLYHEAGRNIHPKASNYWQDNWRPQIPGWLLCR